MTTYKEINGTNIEAVSSDPANPVTGQVWYNTTTNVVKGLAQTTAGAWATGGNLNTGREQLGGAGATRDAALAFGGSPPPAPTAKAITESYNGTSWTEVNDLNSQRAFVTGAGTQTSAIAAGGDQYSGVAESWNGTSWTSITNEPTGSNAYGGAGADSTNALFFGGSPPTTTTRYWNGSSWAALGGLNTARSGIAGAGKTYTAALAAGGSNSPPVRLAIVESFNGSSWTEIADLNDARAWAGGTGTTTSALVFGGDTPGTTGNTEEWNGSAWTETTDLSTARSTGAPAGADNTNALYAGGSPDTTATEEWTGAGSPLVQTFTDS
tara:strand:+ start:829 stop:1800 length:972 start_codon:yes stop_codon:yes gene_type:complete